eukprot:SAG31_NODE_1443_length_8321_cov_6.313306_5_plen_71_part_00
MGMLNLDLRYNVLLINLVGASHCALPRPDTEGPRPRGAAAPARAHDSYVHTVLSKLTFLKLFFLKKHVTF